ncbi:MAG: flagellar hook protein FlgE [Deltaproteobacteria bacterium]|nr:flagellar hook protein FlgE [Deltaproteobacteria bacterium]
MLTSLFTGVSGLNANMTALSVVGNNIANMNTVGFKASRATFSDILSQSLNGVAGSSQVGLGVALSSISPLFTQGALESTGSGMDMAIDGDGFFTMRDTTGALFYSRAGQFNIDKNGLITNPDGFVLRGFQADTSGNISTVASDLSISFAAIPPNITSNVDITANLQSDDGITGFVFTSGSNEDIYFSPDGGTNYYTADLLAAGGLQAGTPYTGGQVAAAIKTSMEAADPGTNTYTVTYDDAAGAFTITNDTGNAPLVVDWSNAASTAETLLGFSAVSSGIIAAGSNDISDLTAGAFDVNNATSTSNFSTAITTFDSLGNSHQVNLHFRKSLSGLGGNTWEWFAVVNGTDTTSGSDEVQAQGTINFDNNGALNSESSITYPTGGFDFSGGATQNQTIAFDFGNNITAGGTGVDGVTQYGQAFAIYNQQQDGYASGSLQSIGVEPDGTLTGIFSNGRTRALGQVTLATFANPASLTSMGKNLFAESTDSGVALSGVPETSGRGSIHSNALEQSTVDIAEEFVKMIAAQRGFQANSRIITTTDEILVELVNLKR